MRDGILDYIGELYAETNDLESFVKVIQYQSKILERHNGNLLGNLFGVSMRFGAKMIFEYLLIFQTINLHEEYG